jgi:anhydro-N-acetylmuramic acid kinase
MTDPMLVLGLMSGTSADGIDVALARISGNAPEIRPKLLDYTSFVWPRGIRGAILRIAEGLPTTAAELSQLNVRLGEAFAGAALAACKRFRVSPRRIALIGSHGQTIYHQPEPSKFLGARIASTLQIGEPAAIAARTGITTVGDFRPADMALGGQGAPLVPYVDYLLYRHPKLGRAGLNLGGIGNVTVIPAAAKPSQIMAFDTGPGNMHIDALVQRFTRGRQRFDRDARMALRAGRVPALLNELMRDPYLKLPPPKSTGRERYGAGFVRQLLRLGRKHSASHEELVRAATVFTALSVVDALHRFVLPKTKLHELIVSGGGSHNPLILAQLAAALPGIRVMTSSEIGVPEDAKEAFAFAILAYETFHRRPSNLPSATGARRPAILGKICHAPGR